MPNPLLAELIDKQDGFEIVRDQIGAILLAEQANQVALATTAGKPDPNLWALRVYAEAFNPWEMVLNDQTNLTPLVNVSYDSGSFPEGRGNVVERQTHVAVFNIDCYGFAVATDDGGTGHNPGDRDAALAAHRAARLVRNILMAGHNTYPQLRGLVGKRWPQSITMLQAAQDTARVPQVLAARLAFRVDFNELSPQVVGDVLEYVAIDVLRAEDGSLYFEADYDLSP